MEHVKVTLCPECGNCPAVEITPEAVWIGEEGNMVRLTHDQWNDLARRVRSGELGTV